MEAKIRIKEALLKYVQGLGKSPDPEERIAAAEEEIRLNDELAELRKRKSRQPAMSGSGG